MEKLHKKRKTKRKAGQKRRTQEKDVARTRGPWAGEGVENGASRRSPLSSLMILSQLKYLWIGRVSPKNFIGVTSPEISSRSFL